MECICLHRYSSTEHQMPLLCSLQEQKQLKVWAFKIFLMVASI